VLLPVIDLNSGRQRLTLAAYAALAAFIMVLLSVTGYRAYDYSDSVRFCGLVCHQVMKPEYAPTSTRRTRASLASPATWGPGARWFVHAKLTGLYQVYAAAFHKYPRPIPPRCTTCGRPGDLRAMPLAAKFFGAQQKLFVHYLTDEKNTPGASRP